MRSNINDIIKVRLTTHGEKIHFDYYYKYLQNTRPLKDCLPKEDSEGYTEYQIWEFAHIFGEYLYNGAEQVIRDNEIVLNSQEDDKILMYQGKQLIRCKECMWNSGTDEEPYCQQYDAPHSPSWFCASGESRKDKQLSNRNFAK